MSQDSTSNLPIPVLREEHQVILRVIGVLDRLVAKAEAGDGFETDPLGKCVEFFGAFADACHHAKEEDLLFPVMESRGIPREGGPIGVMLAEHQMARGFTRDMAVALEARQQNEAEADKRFFAAAHQYSDLLQNHIYKEDNILFNMGDQVLTGQDQQSLCTKFCEVGCQAFRGKKGDELRRMADELEARWPAQ